MCRCSGLVGQQASLLVPSTGALRLGRPVLESWPPIWSLCQLLYYPVHRDRREPPGQPCSQARRGPVCAWGGPTPRLRGEQDGGSRSGLLLSWCWRSPATIPEGAEKATRNQRGGNIGRKEQGCAFSRHLFILFVFNCTVESGVLNTLKYRGKRRAAGRASGDGQTLLSPLVRGRRQMRRTPSLCQRSRSWG